MAEQTNLAEHNNTAEALAVAEKGKKKPGRGWVKNAAIIFLAVMLVLTFFSNTIMNRSLPEVAGANVQSGTISAKVRGSGTVSANSVYDVILDQTRKIDTVRVKVGQEVAVGDVLFTLAGSESEELKSAKETLDSLQTQYRIDLINASAAYTAEQKAVQQAQNALNTAIAKRDTYAGNSSATVEALKNEISSLEEEITELKKQEAATGFSDISEADIKTQQRKVEDAELAYDEAEPGEEAALKLDLERAEEDLRAMKKANRYYEDIVEAEADLALAKTKLTQSEEGFDNWSQANDEVTAAQKALDDAVYALEQKQNVDGAINNIELDAAKRKISEQQKLVNELQSDATGGEITAPMAGVITEVNITAGASTEAEQVLARIESPDQGYYITFSVSVEQAKRLSLGAEAEVSTYYWGPKISATLAAMRPDPEDPQKKRILHFALSGEEITAGATLNVTVGEKSAEYSTVVPNSAVRSDSQGDFVLILEAKSTPLGNRYTARRIDVQVLAKDDINTAVSGGLSAWNDFVITTSSKPISPGTQVRMADK